MNLDILDKNYTPSLNEITNYITGNTKKRWLYLINYLEQTFKTQQAIMYSKCSAKPGWNVKYKTKGRALCTLYPDKDNFTALIVLNDGDMEWFKGMRDLFSDYLLSLYDNCSLFNNTKWLMVDITNDDILNDAINLFKLKIR